MDNEKIRKCPFDSCKTEIPSTMFACLRHWRRMTLGDKRTIQAVYSAWKAETCDARHLRDVQAEVMSHYGPAGMESARVHFG